MIVCEVCEDTHLMPMGDRDVMCTKCPTPCELCRVRHPGAGPGAYCAVTPCRCDCHRDDSRTQAALSELASRTAASSAGSGDIQGADDKTLESVVRRQVRELADAIAASLDAMGLHLATGDQCLPLTDNEREIALAGIATAVRRVLGGG